MTAPVYRDPCQTMETALEQLSDAIKNLGELGPPQELMDQLWSSFYGVKDAAKATHQIVKGTQRVGFGVSKEKKAIACDQLMAVVKAIKSSKAW